MLSSKEKKALKAKAHHLKPVILLGNKGLTKAVIEEARLTIKKHELIKVKIGQTDKDERSSLLQTLTSALDCDLVQHIGNIVTLYKEREDEE